MNKPKIISLALCALMISSAFLSKLMIPTDQTQGQQIKINLESMIPLEFDSWKLEPADVSLMVNPDIKGQLKQIYNQTLSRTYINNKGQRVMLSIAYGGNQSTDLHVHRPEICYAAGGFDIGALTKTFVDTAIGRIPVMHLVAKQGSRNEPITYWIRVGDKLTRGWLEQKLTAIGYGLNGKIPDGLLFRVSTISNDEQDSFRIQQTFLTAILQAVQSEDRYWLVGRLTPLLQP